jgi:uncharacterized membrane protein
MAPVKRGRLWIDPPFQGRLLLRMAASLFVYTFVIWHVGFFFEVLSQVAVSTSAWGRGLGALYADYFRKQVPLLITFVLITPPLLYSLLKFSHRIAGPLYRCRRMMREMAAGQKVPEFKPRKHDLMGELFAAFNELIRTCNARAAEADAPADAEAKAPGAATANGHLLAK